ISSTRLGEGLGCAASINRQRPVKRAPPSISGVSKLLRSLRKALPNRVTVTFTQCMSRAVSVARSAVIQGTNWTTAAALEKPRKELLITSALNVVPQAFGAGIIISAGSPAASGPPPSSWRLTNVIDCEPPTPELVQ